MNLTTKINEIGRLALEALLYEVSVTPKPGLVDRNNSGAHIDMDFFTFMSSAASLNSCFEEFANAGFEAFEKNISVDEIDEILPILRKIGIEAEKKMFHATGNINTHKGEIFSLGLLSSCIGYFFAKFNKKIEISEILKIASKICKGICDKDFANLRNKKFLTKGEKVFLKYGIVGVRGEAENGYPTVKKSLPVLKNFISRGLNINDSLALTLLYIISSASDTNIISRHGIEIAKYVENRAKSAIISIEENLNSEYIRKILFELDEDFINKNISPSGSADLLAVTYFLFAVEKIE